MVSPAAANSSAICLLTSGSIVVGGEVVGSVLSYGTRVDRSEVICSVLLEEQILQMQSAADTPEPATPMAAEEADSEIRSF